MTTPPSEAGRVAERRARIGTQVRTSRQRQGLPDHVTDPATLDRLAGRVLELTELALDTLAREEREAKRAGNQDRARRATTRHQGKAGDGEGSASNGVMTDGAAVMTPTQGVP